jgi:uncharacterized protein (TIGR02147 family)
MEIKGPDIYRYSDFRKFLLDIFKAKRRNNRQLSMRGVAIRAGIDPSLFAKVLKGQRNLAFDHVIKLADAIGLTKSQKAHFELLVRFAQSKSELERSQLRQKILMIQRRKIATLAADHYEYFNRWYIPVIRELINFYPYCGDFTELGNMLSPAISSAEAKQAIDILLRIGVIIQKEDGSLALSDSFLTPSPDLNTSAIHNFQISMLEMAKEAITRFAKDSREISTLTMSLSKDGYARVRERIVDFRKELMDIARSDDHISGVYQFNFQTFPVTKLPKKE